LCLQSLLFSSENTQIQTVLLRNSFVSFGISSLFLGLFLQQRNLHHLAVYAIESKLQILVVSFAQRCSFSLPRQIVGCLGKVSCVSTAEWYNITSIVSLQLILLSLYHFVCCFESAHFSTELLEFDVLLS